MWKGTSTLPSPSKHLHEHFEPQTHQSPSRPEYLNRQKTYTKSSDLIQHVTVFYNCACACVRVVRYGSVLWMYVCARLRKTECMCVRFDTAQQQQEKKNTAGKTYLHSGYLVSVGAETLGLNHILHQLRLNQLRRTRLHSCRRMVSGDAPAPVMLMAEMVLPSVFFWKGEHPQLHHPGPLLLLISQVMM